jgi:nucleoside 2-deoxyribosyltransferase
MPFVEPIGGYYASIYQPAIEKVKLKTDRADSDLYGTGKIIDQIWKGITSARILLAELTARNANVLYELGLAHALHKPVVLICSKANEADVPFDLRHVRVIYYDKDDPFWGTKLIEKIAETILSVLQDPKDAILFPKQ